MNVNVFIGLVVVLQARLCLADTECSNGLGSCGSQRTSLMQLKSFNQKKETASLHSTLAGFQKFTDEMVAKFGSGKQVAAPNNETKNAVAMVIDFINGMYTGLELGHNTDSSIIETCTPQKILGMCDDEHLNATVVVELQNHSSASTTKEQNHVDCRNQRKVACEAINGACDIYDDYRKQDPNALLPACAAEGSLDGAPFSDDSISADSTTAPDVLEDMESCLQATRNWLVPLYERYSNCTRTEDECLNMKAQCADNQTQFETAREVWAVDQNAHCSAHQACYNGAVQDCGSDEKKCDAIGVRAKGREADNETGMRILCLLDVLFGERNEALDDQFTKGFGDPPSAEEKPGKLAECNDQDFTDIHQHWALEGCTNDYANWDSEELQRGLPTSCTYINKPCEDLFENEYKAAGLKLYSQAYGDDVKDGVEKVIDECKSADSSD